MNIGRVFSADNVVFGTGAILGAGMQAASLAVIAASHGQSFADPATVVSALTVVIGGSIAGGGMCSAIRAMCISDPVRKAKAEANISVSTMLIAGGLIVLGTIAFSACGHEASVNGFRVPAGTYPSGGMIIPVNR